MENQIVTRQIIEKCILCLVNEFLQEPFTFFNEAEAVTRFHKLLIGEQSFSRSVKTQDGHEISQIHLEYPTPFAKEDSSKRQEAYGKYDVTILNPEYIKNNQVDDVAKPDLKSRRDNEPKPFIATIELKLHYESLGKNRADDIVAALLKLDLSQKYTEFRYLICLQRYLDRNLNKWNENWPIVEKAQSKYDISSIIGIYWRRFPENKPKIYFGKWL